MEINVAEAIKNTNMCALASKTIADLPLSESEAAVVASLDARFREIGKTGHDRDHEIAAFITKAIETEFNSPAESILDKIFDRTTIGEADGAEDVYIKNTLVAYESAQGGNVPKSYLDVTALVPKFRNRQIETDISYADLINGGWKTVAKVVEYARQAFENALFHDVFADLDAAITVGADNYITVGSATMTQAAADAVATYVNDYAPGDGAIVAYSKHIVEISKLTGYQSNSMLDTLNRLGRLETFSGCELLPVPAVRKQGDGTGLFIDKRVFGVAGKIGTLTMRGDIKTYEEDNINKEKFHLKITGFNYGYTFEGTAAEKVVKAVLS